MGKDACVISYFITNEPCESKLRGGRGCTRSYTRVEAVALPIYIWRDLRRGRILRIRIQLFRPRI